MVLTINHEIIEPRFDTVPIEMYSLNNWVMWRAEPNSRGKVNEHGEPIMEKILKRTNGANASSNNPGTWTSFQNAIQTYNNGNFSGIGFVFQQRHGIIGLDLDNHFYDGEPQTEIAQIICNETYVEISPSGTGAHAYFIGTLPHSMKHKYYDSEGELEIYNDGRFFTFTGEMAGKNEISRNQRFIDRLVEKYFHKPEELKIEQAKQPAMIPSNRIKKKMLRIERIAKLFNGDMSDYNNDSSAADMALANHLAFWTGKHYGQMDALFRESQLYRNKWDNVHSGDGRTYGQMTLERAIAECKNVYKQAVMNPQESSDHVWDDIVTFDSDEVLPFPKNIFPDWLEDFIDQVSQSTQTPREMAAMGAFTALSIATAKKFNVNVYGHWKEPLNTYLLTLMPPSSKKSQVFRYMMEPIYDFQKERRNEVKDAAVHRQDEIETKERQLSALKKRIAEPRQNDNVQELTEQMKFTRDELNSLDEIHEPTYIADDVTSEVLAKLLKENNEKLGIISAEGGLFSSIKGRYSDSTNYDVYLNGYSADRMSTHRLSRDAVELDSPHLTIGVFAQPSVIQDIPKEFFDKGLMARFLYSLPNDNRGERQIRPKQIDPAVMEKYYYHMSELMKLSVEDVSLTMSYQADLRVQLLQEEIEMRQGPGQDLRENEQIEAWAGKLVGQLMRIAGLIHMSEVLTIPEYEINEDTISATERLKEYFISHMRKAFNVSSVDESMNDAKYLLEKINDHKENDMIKRQKLWQNVKKRFKSAKEIDDTLRILEERSYIKVEDYREENKTGRATKMIFLNPMI